MSSNEYCCSKLELKRATRLIASSLERKDGSKFAIMKYTAPVRGDIAKHYQLEIVKYSVYIPIPILYFLALDTSGLAIVISSKYPI